MKFIDDRETVKDFKLTIFGQSFTKITDVSKTTKNEYTNLYKISCRIQSCIKKIPCSVYKNKAM